MIIPNIRKNKKCSKPPTRYHRRMIMSVWTIALWKKNYIVQTCWIWTKQHEVSPVVTLCNITFIQQIWNSPSNIIYWPTWNEAWRNVYLRFKQSNKQWKSKLQPGGISLRSWDWHGLVATDGCQKWKPWAQSAGWLSQYKYQRLFGFTRRIKEVPKCFSMF